MKSTTLKLVCMTFYSYIVLCLYKGAWNLLLQLCNVQLQRLIIQVLWKRILSFQKKWRREFVLTAISFEDNTTLNTCLLFILLLPLTLGSASISNNKEMDICLAMQQFCCAAIDENTLNYFKWKTRFLEKSIKWKYWKVLLQCLGFMLLSRTLKWS